MFMFIHLTHLGPETTIIDLAEPDHILRAGFISFGYDFDIGDGVTRTFWRAPIWLDWIDTEWTPLPQASPTGDSFVFFASRVRWSLSFNTTGHLYVYAG